VNLQERQQLEAEITALTKMIHSMPKDLILEREGFESRKKEIEAILERYPEPKKEAARGFITFRGKPVIGTQGIFVKFASEALGSFMDAVATVGDSMSGNLGARGQVPEREKFSLIITAIAHGSFGFQLEEPLRGNDIQQPLFEEGSPIKLALDKTCEFFRATLGSDDELTNAVSDADARAIDNVRKFLDLLISNQAYCAFDFEKERGFRFNNVSEVQESLERIRQENIHEETIEVTGFFEGVIPKKRDFQFREEGKHDSIVGKIENEIEDAADINNYLKEKVRVTLLKKTVGQGTPRYKLKKYTVLHDSE